MTMVSDEAADRPLPETSLTADAIPPGPGPAARRRRRGQPRLWLGGIFGVAFLLAAAVGPWLVPSSPVAQNLEQVLRPPSATHWLGTDENGVDLLAMIVHGARLALALAGSTVAISFTVGTVLGALAGTVGGWIDEALMRVVDVLLSFPGILLNLAIVALASRPSTAYIVFALAVNGWVGYARVARAQALSVREREYVVAAWASGARLGRVLLVHVIPSILGPLIVQATFGFGGVILAEASLSFLGLGPAVPYTWGSLLAQGTTYLWRSSHLATAPGVAIAMVVLATNLLGDALRDRLDPRGGRGVV
jgi:peptide/nickel transport system permease protein